MIKLDRLQCVKKSYFKRAGYFTEGTEYWGKVSRSGDMYVVKDDKGHWIPVWEKLEKELFTIEGSKYVQNYRVLSRMNHRVI